MSTPLASDDISMVTKDWQFRYNGRSGTISALPTKTTDFEDRANWQAHLTAYLNAHVQSLINDPSTSPEHLATAMLIAAVWHFNLFSNGKDVASVHVPGIRLCVQPNDRWQENWYSCRKCGEAIVQRDKAKPDADYMCACGTVLLFSRQPTTFPV